MNNDTLEKRNTYGNSQHLYAFVPYKDEEHLVCQGCGETKPHTEFRKRKGGWVSTWCKACVNKKYWRDPQQAHLNAIKCRARKSNHPFDLDLDDLQIPERCPVLNIPLLDWGDNGIHDTMDNSPSLDRLVPELGYIKSNVRVISQRANRIKHNATLEELKALCFWLEKELTK